MEPCAHIRTDSGLTLNSISITVGLQRSLVDIGLAWVDAALTQDSRATLSPTRPPQATTPNAKIDICIDADTDTDTEMTDLLDLPSEMFASFVRNYICVHSVRKAWKLHGICSKLPL
jgi:hypothetical protein